ncbi:hypothetical protein A9Q81_23930 [Gammaproteobacteria bacterium 42_54_T18]|nr:hypothetical protein A9Q81_23930 [Gammaproteobacteria bacterium 42_54_T18]
MNERIQAELDRLDRLEREKDIKILLAVESGSRAWGFPSPDSDYDVRFLYVHTTDWYLSVSERRDVVEMPIDDVLDISGWDIRKAFRLLLKSNGTLYEWLSSPLVYRVNERSIAPIKTLAPKVLCVEAMFYHYYAMSKGKMHEASNSDNAKLKTYLYALRPLLCCRWLLDDREAPPMEFNILKERYLPSGSKMGYLVDKLLEEKAVSVEAERRDRMPMLDLYLQAELAKLDGVMGKYNLEPNLELADSAFRKTLE